MNIYSDKMRKLVGSIFCSVMLLGILAPAAIGGDEENPEVSDGENDVAFLNGRYQNPLLSPYFKHIDIVSAWFFENPDLPDTLFISLKFSDFRPCMLTAWYAMFWEMGYESWAAVIELNKGEIELAGVQLHNTPWIEIDDFFSIDEANAILTFSMPKEFIGVASGDTIRYPFAAAAIEFSSDVLYGFFWNVMPLASDYTNEGLEYVIQF